MWLYIFVKTLGNAPGGIRKHFVRIWLCIKYAGIENTEQILGEINGVSARRRGRCQIFYLQDLAHHANIFAWIFCINIESDSCILNRRLRCSIKASSYISLRKRNNIGHTAILICVSIQGKPKAKRLGGGVHVEQGHQLPSQPARCWEVRTPSFLAQKICTKSGQKNPNFISRVKAKNIHLLIQSFKAKQFQTLLSKQ